ncbi:MAG: hypothetical protein Q9184_002099 [Pyrenodesmia sp. 2 TL-2023]
MAFGRVHRLREESKEKRRLKGEHAEAGKAASLGTPIVRANGHAIGHSSNPKPAGNPNGSIKGRATASYSTSPETPNGRLYDHERYSPDSSEDSETESSVSSLVDVDSPHVSSVPSDFESQTTKTKTQAERMAHEAEDKARENSAKASQKTKETAAEADQKASEASSKASSKAKEFSEFASEKSEELSKEVGDKYDKAKKSAARNYKEGKEEAREKGNELSRNRDNPVVVANAVIIGVGSVALGFTGYQKYAKGELSWQVAGMAAAAVGAFAIGDYYVSQ